jgi:RNA polymerase sigma-70 factor (ECF subfamily)
LSVHVFTAPVFACFKKIVILSVGFDAIGVSAVSTLLAVEMPTKRPNNKGTRPKSPKSPSVSAGGRIKKGRSRKERAPQGLWASPHAAPVFPPGELLVAERKELRDALLRCGVPRRELEDAVSDCIAGAWASIQKGKFALPPSVHLELAVKRWLLGIAWRLATHERDRARHRSEVLAADPWTLAPGAARVVDIEGQLIARNALRALLWLPPEQRALLIAAADERPGHVAAALGMARTSVVDRLAEARRALAAAIEGPGTAAPKTKPKRSRWRK